MARIVVVISPHGLGHLTRQIAIKNELLQFNSELRFTFVVSEEQVSFLKSSILNSPQVDIEYLPLTPKLTMEEWNKVDLESTRESFQRFWEWETQIRDDTEWGRILQGADLVINDVESVHNPIAAKMRIPTVNLSNFLWSDILHDIGLKDLASNYGTWESMSKYNIRLSLSLPCRYMDDPLQVGIVSRFHDIPKVEGIRNMSKFPKVLLTFPRKAWPVDLYWLAKKLSKMGVQIMISRRFVDARFNQLPIKPIIIDDSEEGFHNYIRSSDLVISKLGYGTVSEILVSGTPLLFWSRENFAEDRVLSKHLEENGYGQSIDGLPQNDILDAITNWLNVKFQPQENSTREVAKIILKILRDESTLV